MIGRWDFRLPTNFSGPAGQWPSAWISAISTMTAMRTFQMIPGRRSATGPMSPQKTWNSTSWTRSAFSAALFAQMVASQKVIYNNNILYNTDLRLRTQAAYVRFDFEGKYPFTPWLDAGVFVRNLFDVSYQERFGFPAAGRNLGLSLKSKF